MKNLLALLLAIGMIIQAPVIVLATEETELTPGAQVMTENSIDQPKTDLGDSQDQQQKNELTEEAQPGKKAKVQASSNEAVSEEGNTTSTASVGGTVVHSGECGERVTWKLYDNGTLLIEGEGEMMSLTFNSKLSDIPWLSYRNAIFKVIIDSGVSSIGEGMMIQCKNLTSVSIPNSVVSIGPLAFSGCSSLKTVYIPATVTSMGDEPFDSDCKVMCEVDSKPTGWGAFKNENNVIYGVKNNCPETDLAIPNPDTDSTIPAHEHSLKFFNYKMATIYTEGYCEHYECLDCEKWFEDSSAKIEIEKSSITLPKIKAGANGQIKGTRGEVIVKKGDYELLTQTTKSAVANSYNKKIKENIDSINEYAKQINQSKAEYTYIGRDLTNVDSNEVMLEISALNSEISAVDRKILALSNDTSSSAKAQKAKLTAEKKALEQERKNLYADLKTKKTRAALDDELALYKKTKSSENNEMRAIVSDDKKLTDKAYEMINGYEQADLKSFLCTYSNGAPIDSIYSNGIKVFNEYGVNAEMLDSYLADVISYAIYQDDVSIEPTNIIWDDKPIMVDVNVVIDGKKLLEGKDYIVEYSNNTSPGTATVTVSGCASYYGTAMKSFSIKKKPINQATILMPEIYIYDGKPKMSNASVKDINDHTLIYNVDYEVVCESGGKNVGEHTIVVLGTGCYTGTIKKQFVINPKGTTPLSLKRSSKSFTVKWKKQSVQTTGYQIRYSLKSSMKSSKTVTVTKNSTTSKKISKLKAKKKYYVQVRTYKIVSGKKYYSSWSSKKSVSTK